MSSQELEDAVGLEWPRNPFPGLRPFREDESLIFYGRNSQKDEVLARLNQTQLVFVTGPSGCGKSSLIKAGVLPALRAGLLTKAGYHWRILQMRPGRLPLARLAAEFESARPAPTAATEGASDLNNLMEAEESALWLAAEAIAPASRVANAKGRERLLLVIDQFEEIFGEQIRDPQDAGRFVRLLVRFAQRPHPNLFLILTMRSDYLGQCANFEGLAESINRSQFLTPVLTEEELGQAISRPAEDYNGEVEPRLVDQIIRDMRSGFAYHADSLPLMQHALLWLWSEACRANDGSEPPRPPFSETSRRTRLTLAAYEESGGIQGILDRHAEDVLNEAVGKSKDRRKIAQELFRRLSERDSEGRYRRSPTSADNICRTAGCSFDELQHVVRPFEHPDVCFLERRQSTNTGEALVDISHESLIRQWHSAKAWADAEADKLRYFRNLVGFARAWREKDRSPDFLKRRGELEVIQTRWKNEPPTEYWARRYGLADEFARVETYLRVSAETDHAEQRAAEREREEKAAEKSRRQRDRNMGLAAFMICICAVILYFWYHQTIESNRFHARLTSLVADQTTKTFGPARGLLVALYGIDKGLPELPAMERAAYRALAQLRELRILRDEATPASPVRSVQFDPKGRPLLVTASQDGALRFWDPESGRVIERISIGGGFLTARLRPDANELFVSARDIKSQFLVPCSRAALRAFFPQCGSASSDIKREFSGDVGSGVFSPDSRWIVTGSRFTTIKLWDVTNVAEPMRDFAVPGAFTIAAAFSHDSKRLAFGTSAGDIRVFDLVRTLSPQSAPNLTSSDHVKLGGPPGSPDGGAQAGTSRVPTSIAFHPSDPNILLATYQDGVVQLWNIAEREAKLISTQGGWAMQGIFNQSGSWIAAAHEDRAVRLWPVAAVESRQYVLPQVLRGHEAMVFTVAYNADGTKLVSGSSDGTVRLWSQQSALAPDEVNSFNDDSLSGQAQTWPLPGGKTFVVNHIKRGEVVLTTPLNPEPAASGFEIPIAPRAAAVSPSGKEAVVVPRQGRPYLFNLESTEYIVMLPGRPETWQRAGFHYDPNPPPGSTALKIVGVTEDGKRYGWPYFEDLAALKRYADRHIPFDGDKRLETKKEMMCRIEGKPDSECPAGDDSPPE
jgi:WD40 repeat protein